MRKALILGSVSLSLVSVVWGLRGQTSAAQRRGEAIPASSSLNASPDKEAALSAATAWLKILDTGDFKAAARGWADERIDMPALHNYPSREERIQVLAILLAQQRGQDGTWERKFTRTLQPDSVKQVFTCNCGLRDGNFYVMSYDYSSSFLVNHNPNYRNGVDVLYMMQEQDGTWKPAAITWIPKK